MTDTDNNRTDYLSTLNPEQLAAATATDRHVLVLAGAGTGKTRTIIARAHHLIHSGVQPRRILILSFTRKAAREIVERIKLSFPSHQAEGLVGQTFHSWCLSLIKSYPDIFSCSGHTILDEDDRESCFKLLCGKNFKTKDGKSVSAAAITEVYSFALNAQCSLSEAMRQKLYDNAPPTQQDVMAAIEANRPVFAEIIKKYFEYKNERHYLDYDDLLDVVAKCVTANVAARNFIAGHYDHILIDEMQDTNPLQYKLISAFQEKCHLFCVGDDAQSIYGFRGADFKTIHNFTSLVPQSKIYPLTINYRSTQEILDVANWLLDQSPLHYDKHLQAVRGHGEKPAIVHWDDEWEEAEDITTKILDRVNEGNSAWAEHMVLSRSVWGLRKVEVACIDKKIPYIVFGGTGLMQSRHVRDLASPLRIISNFHDELAWMRYLRLWKGIGNVTASKIIGETILQPSLNDCLQKLSSLNLQKEIAATLVSISCMQLMPATAIETALKMMETRLEEIYKEEWQWRSRDFDVLKEVAANSRSVGEFVAEYVLDPKLEITVKDAGKEEDHVILSTIHSAKGLEATHCYLVNVSAFAYPTSRAILNGEDAVEEERRCLYVALTRAKDSLTIYRNVGSIHVSDDESRYFLQNFPAGLAENVVPGDYEDFSQSVGFTGEAFDDLLGSSFNFD